ncbi:hypothetical protein [Spongiactinospora gelatinilytica]|uniref:hypothetical protein n=1 Tax=Spongiactinospora gelatinilytica TaxID=2666298 RepID=UPI0013145C3B|nr:hypothetical protein [Spongiactinospora gelatinilytica]
MRFFAGFRTEYSPSVGDLFVVGVVVGGFAVPAAFQARMPLVGITAALVLRGSFILAGPATCYPSARS